MPNRLENVLFYFNVPLNAFKDIDTQNGLFEFDLFLGARQNVNYDLDLLLILQWLIDLLKFNDHVGHIPHMLSYAVQKAHLVGIELDVEGAQLTSRIDTKFKLQSISPLFCLILQLKITKGCHRPPYSVM